LWWALKAVDPPHFVVAIETHHTVGEPDTLPMLDQFLIARTDHDQSTSGLAPSLISDPADARHRTTYYLRKVAYIVGCRTCEGENRVCVRRNGNPTSDVGTAPAHHDAHVTRPINIESVSWIKRSQRKKPPSNTQTAKLRLFPCELSRNLTIFPLDSILPRRRVTGTTRSPPLALFVTRLERDSGYRHNPSLT
jgi:hypothetical protein